MSWVNTDPNCKHQILYLLVATSAERFYRGPLIKTANLLLDPRIFKQGVPITGIKYAEYLQLTIGINADKQRTTILTRSRVFKTGLGFEIADATAVRHQHQIVLGTFVRHHIITQGFATAGQPFLGHCVFAKHGMRGLCRTGDRAAQDIGLVHTQTLEPLTHGRGGIAADSSNAVGRAEARIGGAVAALGMTNQCDDLARLPLIDQARGSVGSGRGQIVRRSWPQDKTRH